jgi:hypothetical protein
MSSTSFESPKISHKKQAKGHTGPFLGKYNGSNSKRPIDTAQKMSDSDSSDSSSVEFGAPVQMGSPTQSKTSKGTGTTYNSFNDHSDDDSSLADTDTENESDVDKARNVSATKKPANGEALPPGISNEAFMAFFSKDLDTDDLDATHNANKNHNLDLDSTDHLLKQHYDLMTKSLSDLNLSQHSLKSLGSFLDEIEEDLKGDDDATTDKFVVDNIKMKDASKIYKEEKKKKKDKVISTPEVNELMLKKQKRDQRLEKVRERIRLKEEKKHMERFQVTELDMSEAGRRERCYEWYKRLSMPSKEEMKEKILSIPPSSGVTVEDIELLPWNTTERVVNPRKMQSLSVAKKSFRSTKAKDPDDSD